MTTLSRRALLGLSAAAVLTSTGCSGGSGGSGSEPQTLYTSWYGADPVHQAMDANLKAFAAAHAGVTTSSSHAPFADYWDKLATEVAGGKGPDVYRMSMSYFSEYADRGALLDLTELAGSTIATADLDADVLASGTIDGKMMAIGQSSISHATFRNPTLVDSVGGKLPTEWDWAGLAEFAKGFAGEVGAGKWGVSDAGGNFQIFEVYARQHGTELFSGSSLAVGLDVIESWFAYWDDLRKAKAAPPADVSGETGTIETSTLGKGTTPIAFGWVQQVTFYQPLVGDSVIEVMPVPGKTPGSTDGQFLKALDFWAVSGATKAPELAAQLVSYLVNDPAAIKSTGLTLGVPPSAKARELVGAESKSAAGRAIAYVDTISERVGPPPAAWPKGYGALLSGFTRANENVGFGKADPAKAAADFVAEAKTALAG